jgi:drug/metabolite transporter (DMT)-like permease
MSWRAWTTFAILCAIWGTPYFLIKLAIEEFSPAVVAWGRITLGAAVLVPIACKRGVLKPALRHKAAVTAFAVAELVIPFLLIAQGEQWVSSSFAGILIATVPMTVVVIAPLFGVKEALGTRRVVGLAIGFFGVVALLGLDTGHGASRWAGVACMMVAVVGYAVGPLVVQKYLAGVDELGSLAASLVVASIILLPLAWLSAPIEVPGTIAILSVAALGVMCTALALLLYFFLIHEAGAARASVVAYINPAVAALLGVLVLNEPFGWGSVLGLGFILFGSWLATSHPQAQPSTAPGAPERAS